MGEDDIPLMDLPSVSTLQRSCSVRYIPTGLTSPTPNTLDWAGIYNQYHEST